MLETQQGNQEMRKQGTEITTLFRVSLNQDFIKATKNENV